MLVHCAGRLGFISFIYKQRNEIAFSMGLTAEKVIAICKGDYHQQFKLADHQGVNDTAPIAQAHEINLFFAIEITKATSNNFIEINTGINFYNSIQYNFHLPDIFRPPLI